MSKSMRTQGEETVIELAKHLTTKHNNANGVGDKGIGVRMLTIC